MTILSRERQRELGVLKSLCEKAAADNRSTGEITIHLSSDDIDWLTRVGGQVFRDYTSKERRRMASRGQALPDGSFPIASCTDAENAIRSVGRAKDRAKAEEHIRKRVRALGCQGDIFDAWR